MTVHHERRLSAGNKEHAHYPTLKASDETNNQVKMTFNLTTKITFMTWL